MGRILGILIFSIIQLNSFSQLNIFIGQTKPQVVDFWSTRVSTLYFLETDESSFVIMKDNGGFADFNAEFNGKGKCTLHEQKITYEEISIYISRLKKAGYVLTKEESTWLNSVKKIKAKIEPAGIQAYILSFETTVISSTNK